MKGVQCYELFGGIALKNHTFSFFSYKTHNAIYPYIVEFVQSTQNKLRMVNLMRTAQENGYSD